jgi:hypothetical protein
MESAASDNLSFAREAGFHRVLFIPLESVL